MSALWRKILFLFCLAALPGLAWAEAPTGFAGLPWGTRSDKVYEYTRAEKLCTFLRDDVDLATCEHYDLAGVGRGTVYFLSLIPTEPDAGRYTGTLAGYYITFPYASYPAFRRAVVDKFGPPHRQETKTYRTGGGATTTGEELTWRWLGVSATLNERCDKLTQLCLSVTTPPIEAQQAERARRDREKARRSF